MAGFVFGLSTCCTKKKCNSVDEINEIKMLNFVANDVDSVAVETFPGNSNFAYRTDSMFTSAHGRDAGDTELIIFMNKNINISSDYKITLMSTGQVYKLTGFTNRKQSCNSCFPRGHDYVSVLDKYNVNGTEKHADYNVIIVDK